MAERRENSVLFSLKELRQIEDDRVRQEQEAERAQHEATQRAIEEQARRQREEIERRARDEEERLRKLQEDKERQIREEQLRLEAEKHRAEVEAKMKLEEARLQAQAQAQAAARKQTPVGLILGSVGGVVLIAAAAMAYVMLVYIPQRDAVAAKRAEEQMAVIRQQLKEQQAKFDDRERELKDALAKTTNEIEKAKIQAQLAENEAKKAEVTKVAQKQASEVRERVPVRKAPSAPRTGGGGGPSKPNCDPNDPLCGSGL